MAWIVRLLRYFNLPVRGVKVFMDTIMAVRRTKEERKLKTVAKESQT
jgi:hypothetical protein